MRRKWPAAQACLPAQSAQKTTPSTCNPSKHTSCCFQWCPEGPSPCHCLRRSYVSSAEMHPWTPVHWTHCRWSHCCWHPCRQPRWGQDKVDAVEAQGMEPLQDKRIPPASGPLPHQPLRGGRSCLGHGERRRTGKAERPPERHEGARRPGQGSEVGDSSLRELRSLITASA